MASAQRRDGEDFGAYRKRLKGMAEALKAPARVLFRKGHYGRLKSGKVGWIGTPYVKAIHGPLVID
jgi:hypothetical protein